MNDGRSEWPGFVKAGPGPARYVLIRRPGMGSRDALMVNGFDIIGQNRTLQVHWAKRIVAFALDCVVVLSPVWIFLYVVGERRVSAYGVFSGIAVFAHPTVAEGIWRETEGETDAGLQVRSPPGADNTRK